jgi:putative hydrolase of HD superfamily
VLSKLSPGADGQRMLQMALFHDLQETRTGDLNSVTKLYVTAAEDEAWKGIAEGLPFGPEMAALAVEFREGKTLEARLTKDADHLEMLLSLKEELDAGNPLAADWIPHVQGRVSTPEGRRLAEAILAARSDRWWLERLFLAGGDAPQGKEPA